MNNQLALLQTIIVWLSIHVETRGLHHCTTGGVTACVNAACVLSPCTCMPCLPFAQ